MQRPENGTPVRAGPKPQNLRGDKGLTHHPSTRVVIGASLRLSSAKTAGERWGVPPPAQRSSTYQVMVMAMVVLLESVLLESALLAHLVLYVGSLF